jgi:glycosyltransferase involved in cell wall biosynthesis
VHIVIDARIINSSTGRYVERLVYYLQDIDTENTYTILVPTKDLDFFKPHARNFTVKAADFKNYSLAEQLGFKKFLDSLTPDLVHFCMPQQPVLFKGRHVTTVHDLTLLKTYNSDKNWLIFHAKQLIGRFVFKHIANSSAQIITPTNWVKSDFQKFSGISPDKITVTYEATDVFADEIKPYRHPFNQYMLYVGQQSDYKNIKKLGDTHQLLLEKYPDLGLILVGKKTQSHIKNEAYFKAHNYRNILFTDFVEDAQRDYLFKNCSVYVFPSLMEGFGLPGLEAMGYGAPVASSNATCLPEVYGDAAHYFNPLDIHDMKRAIEDILVDKALREELIQKGYKQLKKYSWLRMARQTHDVYMQALKT